MSNASEAEAGKIAHQMHITLGDWSGDGHRICENVLINCSHTPEELRVGYKESCKKTGLFFTDEVASGYEERTMKLKAVEVFTSFDCPFEELLGDAFDWDAKKPLEEQDLEPKYYIRLLMWFIGLSLKNLTYENAKNPPGFNGWGEEDLSEGCNTSFFGYGLYS